MYIFVICFATQGDLSQTRGLQSTPRGCNLSVTEYQRRNRIILLLSKYGMFDKEISSESGIYYFLLHSRQVSDWLLGRREKHDTRSMLKSSIETSGKLLLLLFLLLLLLLLLLHLIIFYLRLLLFPIIIVLLLLLPLSLLFFTSPSTPSPQGPLPQC